VFASACHGTDAITPAHVEAALEAAEAAAAAAPPTDDEEAEKADKAKPAAPEPAPVGDLVGVRVSAVRQSKKGEFQTELTLGPHIYTFSKVR
jgi:hypothetical protein